MYDVIIIGAGVTGCSIARELSRYKLRTLVLEKGEDVCTGTSKANSAIVHAGYDAVPGTLKAKLNRLGNEMMGEVADDLDVPFSRIGSFVVCLKNDDPKKLQALYERGIANGIKGLEIITDINRLHEMEPNLSDDVVAALYAPTAGIICPFLLTIAMAENAYTNGVEFRFNEEVSSVSKEDDGSYVVRTAAGVYNTRTVVNAAGVYADAIHNMVSAKKLHITARKGEYCLLDHTAGGHVKHTIFVLPNEFGKGILVSPTIHGNLLLGPTAVDVDDKEATNTTGAGLTEVNTKCFRGVKNIPTREVITSFAGLRAHEDGDDFVIGEPEDAAGFFDAAGIESPGLTSAPAIGRTLAGQIAEKLKAEKNENFNGRRKGILDPKKLTLEERNELIRKNPAYGTIICRCESVTEGEIIDAITRPLGAKSLDGVKRRVRAGMGRCQGGFCSPRVMDLLKKYRNVPMADITKSGGKSQIVFGYSKKSEEV